MTQQIEAGTHKGVGLFDWGGPSMPTHLSNGGERRPQTQSRGGADPWMERRPVTR